MYEKIELDELIDDFIEQNTDGILKGARGVKNLESLLSQLAYAGVGDFLADNPMAIERVLSWIGNQDQITEWRDAILDSITPTHGDNEFIEDIEDFIEQNTDGILEGTRGVKNLESLLKQISGYTGVGDFLADNPRAIDAVLRWIGYQDQITEWHDALLDSIKHADDDGDPIAAAASKLD